MASPLFSFSLVCCFLILRGPPFAAANLQKTSSLFRSHPISDPSSVAAYSAGEAPPLTRYFEVTNPISLPNTKPCSYLALQHDFASTYGKPPVLAHYSPPPRCRSQGFARIVLEWTAASKGRQFDRIFGVWLDGVEILRSCTAEPRATGTVWTVKKDVTRYNSLLTTGNKTLAVYMGNIVDTTYTGVYHVNITLHFYPFEQSSSANEAKLDSWPDLILPISRNLPLNDGLWFEISNSTDFASKKFKIPKNAYKGVLEVYVSFHENDEFWYGNYPNEYISANNLTTSVSTGNGPFREVVVSLDGLVVGSVFPFTVIYTGGVNPLMWRPITGIGSFDLPSYDFKITPFLGMMLDGKAHEIAFHVSNALNVWYIDANLHLWLDHKSMSTEGKLLEHTSSPLSLSLVSDFTGLDGLFVTNASRTIVSSGWVKSSHGLILTKSRQRFKYSNKMVLKDEGNTQIVNQEIHVKGSVDTKMPSSPVHSVKSLKKFGLFMYSDYIDKGNGSYVSSANVTLGVKGKEVSSDSKLPSRMKNLRNAQGYILVKGNLVVDGLGSTQQEYRYSGNNSCYLREVSCSNYTILHDKECSNCGCHRQGSSALGTEFLGSKFRVGDKGLL